MVRTIDRKALAVRTIDRKALVVRPARAMLHQLHLFDERWDCRISLHEGERGNWQIG